MNRFSICRAYAQLEADYNVGGVLRERPSSQRRLESIGAQLSRIGFSNPYSWVDIEAAPGDEDDVEDDEVREIYMRAVLRWDLPIDAALMRAMRRYFVPEFLAEYPQTAHNEYKQGNWAVKTVLEG